MLGNLLDVSIKDNSELQSENEFMKESLKTAEQRLDETLEELRVCNRKADRLQIEISRNSFKGNAAASSSSTSNSTSNGSSNDGALLNNVAVSSSKDVSIFKPLVYYSFDVLLFQDKKWENEIKELQIMLDNRLKELEEMRDENTKLHIELGSKAGSVGF
jgi:hypothetical protein